MYEKKIADTVHCPIEYGLNKLCGKWKSRIICVLSKKGALRYGQLKQEMVNVTDTALTAALKELMADGLILRRQYEEIPPKVMYTLTSYGKSAVPILMAVAEWAHGYSNEPIGYDAMPVCSLCGFVENLEICE